MDMKRVMELMMESMRLAIEYEEKVKSLVPGSNSDIDKFISDVEGVLDVLKRIRKNRDELEQVKLDMEEMIFRNENS